MRIAESLIRHALETLWAPRQQARWAMSLDLSPAERWQALVLNAVASTLLLWCWTYLNISEISVQQQGAVQAVVALLVLEEPVLAGAMQFGFAAVSVYALHWGGRMFGGRGDLDSAVSLLAWMAFVLNLISLLQIAFWFVIPFMAGMIGLFSLVLIVVLLTCFCAELHGFRSLFMTFIGMVFVFLLVLFGFSLLLMTLVQASTPGVSV